MPLKSGFGIIETPLQIPGSYLWLDPNDYDTFTFIASKISKWLDKSGNNNHVSQSTAIARPPLDPIGINGRPAVVPDGVDDFLVSTVNNYTSDKFTVFYVGEHQSYAQFKCAVSFSGAGANDFDSNDYAIVGYGTSSLFLDSFRNLLEFGQVTRPAIGVPFTYAIVFDGVNGTPYLNGIAGTPTAISGNFNFSRIQLAARWAGSSPSTFFNVKIGDIAMYSRGLSAPEILKLHKYEARKYGLLI